MKSIIERLNLATHGTKFRTKAGITLVYQERMDESYNFPHVMYDPLSYCFVSYSDQGQLCNGWRDYPAYELITDQETEMKNETRIKSKQKYDEAEVRKLLADKNTRIKWLHNNKIYKTERWAGDDIWLLTIDKKVDSSLLLATSTLCSPDQFTFFKEVSRLEQASPKLVPDESSIQEVVAASKVGDLFETEGHTELELVEINANSKYARYVFKGTGKLFGDDPTVNSFSSDLQTSNNRPIQNPNWKIVRKI